MIAQDWCYTAQIDNIWNSFGILGQFETLTYRLKTYTFYQNNYMKADTSPVRIILIYNSKEFSSLLVDLHHWQLHCEGFAPRHQSRGNMCGVHAAWQLINPRVLLKNPKSILIFKLQLSISLLNGRLSIKSTTEMKLILCKYDKKFIFFV